MEYITFWYVFFTGCIYTSYLWNTKDGFVDKFVTIVVGFTLGWFVTPILIGRTIKQIFKE